MKQRSRARACHQTSPFAPLPQITRRQLLQAGAASLMGAGATLPHHANAQANAQANPAAANPPAPNGVSWRNWSGIQSCQAQALETPADEAAVVRLMANSPGAHYVASVPAILSPPWCQPRASWCRWINSQA